jgi:hypothetical protein
MLEVHGRKHLARIGGDMLEAIEEEPFLAEHLAVQIFDSSDD